MSNSAAGDVSPRRNRIPPVPPQKTIDEIIRQITHQIFFAMTIAEVLRVLREVLIKNATAISKPLMAAGGAMLAPGFINAIGFTATGVLKASAASLIQSVFYGPYTGGIFSILQRIGAVVMIPTAVNIVGGIGLVAGIGAYHYCKTPGEQEQGQADKED